MSLIDKMRAAQGRSKLPAPGQKKRDPGRIEAESTVAAEYSCGHPISVKALTKLECNHCRNEQRKKNNAAKKAKKKTGSPSPDSGSGPGRFPNGTKIMAQWDASKQAWSAIIVIKHPDGREETLADSAAGIHSLLMNLGRKFFSKATKTAS